MFLAIGLFSVAQVSFLPPAYVPNATTAKLDVGIPANTIIFVGALHVPYICIKTIGGGTMTMAQAISGAYIAAYSYNLTDSTYLHSTGVEKAYGTYTFYNPLSIWYGSYGNFASLVVPTTLTLPGTTNTVVKTTGNANSVTFAHSAKVTDTAFATVGFVTTANSTNNNTATIIATKVPWFTVAAGVCTHNVVSVLDTCGCAALGLTTSGMALCQYVALTTSAVDTLPVVYQYKAGWITFQGKYKKDIKYWIPKY